MDSILVTFAVISVQNQTAVRFEYYYQTWFKYTFKNFSQCIETWGDKYLQLLSEDN